MKKKVAIIGAGPCGLCALKEMLEAGHDAIAFEQASMIGGAFAHESTYGPLSLTISNYFMAFSDFPPDGYVEYSSKEDYLQYLQRYTEHFNLYQKIQFNSSVQHATLNPQDNKWTLQVLHADTLKEHIFDALVVATGANATSQPNIPEFPGFTGEIYHSIHYSESLKKKFQEEQKKVLVVGAGESSADVAHHLSLVTTTFLWSRRPPLLGPRFLAPVKEMDGLARKMPLNTFLEWTTISRLHTGLGLALYSLIRQIVWRTLLRGTLATWCRQFSKPSFFRADSAGYVGKSALIAEAVEEKRLDVIVSSSVHCEGKKIFFSGTDREVEVDAIVACTGYKLNFDFLKNVEIACDPRAWYKHCIPPKYRDTLFFVGYARPHQGGIPACAEILSRYLALVLRGDRKLPDDIALQTQKEAEQERKFYVTTPSLNSLVDYTNFMDAIAKEIGCEPQAPALFRLFNFLGFISLIPLLITWSYIWLILFLVFSFLQIGLYGAYSFKYLFFPVWPCWYRQRGPGARHDILNSVLKSFPLSSCAFDPITPCVYALYLIQRPITCIVFPLYLLFSQREWLKMPIFSFLIPRKFVLHGTKMETKDVFEP